MMNSRPMRRILVAFMVVFFSASCAKQDSGKQQVQSEATEKGVASKMTSADHADTVKSGNNWKDEFGGDVGTTIATAQGSVKVSTKQPAEMYGIAVTPAEAEWLERKGFLSHSSRYRFSKMSEIDLKELSKKGDRQAFLYLAEKSIDGGNGRAVVAALMGLADRENSIPARYLLARYESQGMTTANATVPVSADPAVHQAWRSDEMRRQTAASYLMQNYLMGDYRAGQMLYDVYPLTGDAGIPPVVLTKALESIQESRAQNPGYAATFDPRPIPAGTYGRGAAYPVD